MYVYVLPRLRWLSQSLTPAVMINWTTGVKIDLNTFIFYSGQLGVIFTSKYKQNIQKKNTNNKTKN